MEEKKQIKISLGTVILLFIIMILLVALAGMCFYFNNKLEEKEDNIVEISKQNIIEKNEDEIIEKEGEQNIIEKDKDVKELIYKTLSLDTATRRDVDNGIARYNIKKNNFGLHLSIREGKVYFTSELDKKQWVEYEVATSEADVKVAGNFEVEIIGFNKRIVDAEISCNGQMISDCYVVFLMEDGTLEYSSIKNIVTNLTTEGKVNNVSNIQRIYNCSVGYADGGGKSSIIALDHENNMYDVGYILYDKSI